MSLKRFSIIVGSLMFLAACEKHTGDIKIYNVEAANLEGKPGLIRRDRGGNIVSHVTWDQADKQYGCMLWDDWSEIVDRTMTLIDAAKHD